MVRHTSHIIFAALGGCLILATTGCVSTPPPKEIIVQVPSPPVFPPQKTMESGDYASFFAENDKAVKECSEAKSCDEALFNLGFLHAYSRSPYYSQTKALKYFDELINKYPGSPYAFQARTLVDIMKRSIASEKSRRKLKGEIKSKDSTIDELQDQIKRSREIDMEMDRKERELLQ